MPERTINKLIIHCSASPNGRHYDIEDIDNWHKERRFKRSSNAIKKHRDDLESVGYHYVITVDGDIQQGRSIKERGAHVRGQNTDSIGVCMIGEGQYSAEQWKALKLVAMGILHEYPNIEIYGHRHFTDKKTCPCFSVDEWIQNEFEPLSAHVLERP